MNREKDVTIAGVRYHLNAADLAQRLAAIEPEPITEYAVEVNGRYYPVKQALAVGLGSTLRRSAFDSVRARHILEQLGLAQVRYPRHLGDSSRPAAIPADAQDGPLALPESRWVPPTIAAPTIMPAADERAMADAVYALIQGLPRYDYQTPRRKPPDNGIYLFFERGEVRPWRGGVTERVVRVGTHRKDGKFPDRIRWHYGNARSLGDHRGASVFRKQIGAALLRRADPDDPRLPVWLDRDDLACPDIEERVSRLLRDAFTFCCFRVDHAEERLHLERGLIALFARSRPLFPPSADWLGHYSPKAAIRDSGLWNTHGVAAAPLTPDDYRRLEHLVRVSRGQAEG